jgi:hypothetical protein
MVARLLVLICIIALPLAAEESVVLNYSMRTADAALFEQELIAWAEDRSGYLQALSNESLTLRFSSSTSLAELAQLLKRHGTILEESVNREDLAERVHNVKTGLAIKEKHLESLHKLFSGSDREQTIAIEKELHKIVLEIERLKGELRLLDDRMQLHTAIVRFRNVSVPARQSSIQFPWIQALTVDSFLEGF